MKEYLLNPLVEISELAHLGLNAAFLLALIVWQNSQAVRRAVPMKTLIFVGFTFVFFLPLNASGLSILIPAVALGFERWMPRVRTTGSKTTYNNIVYSVGRTVTWGVMIAPLVYFYQKHPPTWGLATGAIPFVLTVLFATTAADLMVYWIHRAEHAFPLLWRFHRVHHSTSELNLMGSARTHWWGTLVYKEIPYLGLLYALGTPMAALPWVFFAGMITFLSHANVDFPRAQSKATRWIAWLISTPNYHGHHHVLVDRMDHNYSEVFPIWDVVFGTFHFPEEAPNQFGIIDPSFPDEEQGVFKQLIASFRRNGPPVTSTPETSTEEGVSSKAA